MNYQIGDHAGFIDLAQGCDAVPMPREWLVLRVHPNYETRVMRAFDRRNISAYFPTFVRTIARSSGTEARKPHLGRRVAVPLFPGLILVPDFEFENSQISKVDNVKGFLMFGDRYATLSPKLFADILAIVALLNTPRSERKFQVGQRVRFIDGPFSDFVAIVDRLDSRGRLRVFLDAMKRGVSVEATEAQLEPA